MLTTSQMTTIEVLRLFILAILIEIEGNLKSRIGTYHDFSYCLGTQLYVISKEVWSSACSVLFYEQPHCYTL